MFTDKIEPIISNGVVTIGGKGLITKLIGTVSWSWTDDERQLIFFPESPVSMLSETTLS